MSTTGTEEKSQPATPAAGPVTPPKEPAPPPPSPLQEIVQPFIDLVKAPRALWGVNIAYTLEGLAYFGILTYLAMYFSDYVFQSVEHSDEWSHQMVGVLTAGIAISMVVLGFVPDKWGVRKALILSFVLLLGGRFFLSAAPNLLGQEPTRPGVKVGDKVSLQVQEVGTFADQRAVLEARVVALTPGTPEAVAPLSVDLAEGAGVAPGPELEGHVVRLSQATVVNGNPDDKNEWEVRYGATGVASKLFLSSQKATGLCVGATFQLKTGYVTQRNRQDVPGAKTFLIRSNWHDDFGAVDRTGCKEQPELDAGSVDVEAPLQAKERWAPVKPEGSPAAASLAELRTRAPGKADLLLSDATVSYVRNGGYYVQQAKDGPAIFVFVNPEWSALHLLTMLGILFILLGYGMYQPGAYAAVRQFTTPKTSAMAYAMLYALMNGGSSLAMGAFIFRDREFLNLGIIGTFWIFTFLTLVSLLVTVFVLSRKTVEDATRIAKEETAKIEQETAAAKKAEGKPEAPPAAPTGPATLPVHIWFVLAAILGAFQWRLSPPWSHGLSAAVVLAVLAVAVLPKGTRQKVVKAVAEHPLGNTKFFFFIFALIPVQTLFTYNWLILPVYIERAYEGWIGSYFEIASNANPVLIFILAPMIAAMTAKSKIYNMMFWGTLVMGASAFVLAIGPYPWTLGLYILLMTVGEAVWSPRFLQYATEIAPEGKAGQYQGVAQLPWFLTKFLVPLLYSGWMLGKYCPADGPKDTQSMWFIFGVIAVISPLMLLVAKGWIGSSLEKKGS